MKPVQLYAGISETKVEGRSAAALALSSGEKKLLLATFDVMGLDVTHASAVNAAVSLACGIPARDVMLVCSGSASGPVTCAGYGRGEPDETALSGLPASVAELASGALKALAPASAGAYRACVPQVSHNGRVLTRNLKAVNEWLGLPESEALRPEGPADPDLDVLAVRDASGEIMALLWCHSAAERFGDSLGDAVQRGVDRRFGRHVPCLHLPGCGANVEFTYDLERTAGLLADSIVAAALEACCDPTPPIGSAKKNVILAVRDYTRFLARADVELKCTEAVPAFERELELMRKAAPAALPAPVQVFRVGPFAITGLPGNAFSELGLEIKRQSTFKATCATGFCNGTLGFILPAPVFDNGGFETWPARWAMPARGCGEFLTGELADMLKRL